jgi:hypothetical protein
MGWHVDGFPSEAAVHQLEKSLPFQDFIPKYVELLWRLRAEEIPKRLVDQETVPVRPENLQANGGVLEQPVQKSHGIADSIQAGPFHYSSLASFSTSSTPKAVEPLSLSASG